MKLGQGRSGPSWRAAELRVLRPGLWLIAAAVVGMLLVEVWEGSRLAQLSLALGQDRTALELARARLAFVRADRERRATRAEIAPLAARWGLAPADAQQVIALPSAYLAAAATPTRDGEPASVLAWLPGAMRPGGVVVTLAYHSGEDRRIKQALRGRPEPATRRKVRLLQARPAEGPWQELNRKVVTPSLEERAANPRARSARLRAFRRNSA